MNVARIVKSLGRRVRIIIFATAAVALVGIGAVIILLVTRPDDDETVLENDDSQLISQDIERLDNRLESETDKGAQMSLLQTKVETYKSIGQYDQAIGVSKQLAEEYPANASFQADIARLYELKGDDTQARQYWQNAVQKAEAAQPTEDSQVEIDDYRQQLESKVES